MAARSKEFRSDVEKAAWNKVADLDQFRWEDLRAAGVADNTAKTFVRRWESTGRTVLVGKEDHRKIYRNAEKRVEPVAPNSADRTPSGNMWIAMRRLKSFSAIDVAAHANAGGIKVSVQQAHSYLRLLQTVGYLRVVQTAIPGKRQAIYRLINDTGRQAPVSRRVSGVIDPNTGDFLPLNLETGR